MNILSHQHLGVGGVLGVITGRFAGLLVLQQVRRRARESGKLRLRSCRLFGLVISDVEIAATTGVLRRVDWSSRNDFSLNGNA